MFQIETALLKFDALSGQNDNKTSVVKRCVLSFRFYPMSGD
jgi:hypothetical protein